MDIGVLTGELELKDSLSSGLEIAADHIREFAEEFEGMTSVLIGGAALVVTAIAGITTAIVKLGEKGAEINDVASTLDRFAGGAAVAEDILVKLRAGTLDTVSDMDLMRSSSKLLAAGVKLTADQFGTLSQTAFILQNQGLGPTKNMLDMVSQAMLTGRTRSLEMKIGKLDLTKGEEAYAKSLGTTLSQLNATGLIEAKRYALLGALNKKVQEAGEQHRDFGEQLEFAQTQIGNWTEKLEQQVAASPHVNQALESIGAALVRVFGSDSQTLLDAVVSSIDKFSDGVTKAVPYVESFMKGVKDTIKFLWDYKGAIEDVVIGLAVYKTALIAIEGWQTAVALSSVGMVTKIKAAWAIVAAPATLLAIGATMGAAWMDGFVGVILGKGGVKGLQDNIHDALNGALRAKVTDTIEFRIDPKVVEETAKNAAVDLVKMTQQQLDRLKPGALNEKGLTAGDITDFGDNYHLDTLIEGLKGSGDAIEDVVKEGQRLDEIEEAIRRNEFAALQFKIVVEQSIPKVISLADAMEQLPIPIDQFIGPEQHISLAITNAKTLTDTWSIGLGELSTSFQSLAQVAGDSLGGLVKDIGTVITSLNTVAKGLEQAKAGFTGFDSAGNYVGKNKAAGVSGAASAVAGVVGGTVSGIQQINAGGKTEALGAAQIAAGDIGTGAMIGSIIPGIGTAVGAAAGAVVAGITIIAAHFGKVSQAEKDARVAADSWKSSVVSTFDSLATASEKAEAGTEEWKKVNIQVRDAFIQMGSTESAAMKALGTVNDASHQSAAAVAAATKSITDTLNKVVDVQNGVSALTDAWKAYGNKLPDSVKPAIDALLTMKGLTDDQRSALQALTADVRPNYEQLTKDAADLGITLEQLGPKFEQGKLEDSSMGLLAKIKELQAAGGDLGGELGGAAGKISEMVNESKKFGTAIPEDWKPYLTLMSSLGQLTDDQGKAISDLTDIKFEDTPLDRGITSLNEAIEHLASVLNSIPGAAGNAASALAGLNTTTTTSPTVSVSSPATTTAGFGGSSGSGDTVVAPAQLVLKDGRVIAEIVAPDLIKELRRQAII